MQILLAKFFFLHLQENKTCHIFWKNSSPCCCHISAVWVRFGTESLRKIFGNFVWFSFTVFCPSLLSRILSNSFATAWEIGPFYRDWTNVIKQEVSLTLRRVLGSAQPKLSKFSFIKTILLPKLNHNWKPIDKTFSEQSELWSIQSS